MLLGRRPHAAPVPLRPERLQGNKRPHELAQQRQSIPANSIVGAGIWRTGGLTAINRSHGAIGNQSSRRVFGTPFYISARSPATLTESNLNGATVTVSLVGHTFASGVSASSFALVSAVNGLSVSGITGRGPQHQRHPARWP